MPQWVREDNNARNGSWEKKPRKAKTKMGERHHIISLVRWQQQAEWRRTGISFAATSGQRRPDEDMLQGEYLFIYHYPLPLNHSLYISPPLSFFLSLHLYTYLYISIYLSTSPSVYLSISLWQSLANEYDEPIIPNYNDDDGKVYIR